MYFLSGRVGLVVRALAFHQCGPSLISTPGVICGLSLLVLYSAMRGFTPGTPVFHSHQKPTFDLIWFVNNDYKNNDLGNVDLISSRIVKRIWKLNCWICAIEINVIIIIINISKLFRKTSGNKGG